MPTTIPRAVAALTALLTLSACTPAAPTAAASQPPASTPTSATPAAPAPQPLPGNGQFDYQIGGPYAPAASVAVVSRDRLETPVTGIYNVCYVNTFQSQPQDKAFWTKKHRSLLVQRKGKLVTDPDWPGEYLFNTSTAAKRKALVKIIGPWLDRCATDGYQAVEPDNLDSWTRSKKVLDQGDNVAFAKLLVQRAHTSGLAIAQKNTNQLGSAGKKIGFDFAITEECQVYTECDDYTDVYGDQVIEIEYTDNPRRAYTQACAARGSSISVILRDRDVVTKGKKAYRYENC